MTAKTFLRTRLCWCAAMAMAGSAYSQVNNASLSGLVNDATQGVISGVSVKVKNNSTNASREVKTDGAGYYYFATLPVGDYAVSAEHPGFQKAVERVTLQTAQKARLDFSLTIGQVGTTIEVASAAPQFSRMTQPWAQSSITPTSLSSP
jgi:hypothetical protein